MTKKQDWNPYNLARHNFFMRDSQGFANDIAALEAHILNLQAICPQDKLGWPHPTARLHIQNLKRTHSRALSALTASRSVKATRYDPF